MTRTTLDIARWRLANQRLSSGAFASAQEVVRWMGAVQAQEYGDAKWALGLRMRHANDAAVERAIADGAILRTHVLRPTWHFVAPADIRWMLALTGPRVSAAIARYNGRLELDAAVFTRSQRVMARALRGGVELTRQELRQILQKAGIRADDTQQLAHIAMQAELDAVICSGRRRGKQFTYALLDERVPPVPARSRDDGLAELARRYFTSHGPAQVHDFAWWSGLSVADARNGIAAVEPELASHVVDGRTYWMAPAAQSRRTRPSAYLLPLYDEYLIAYRDRSAALDPSRWARAVSPDPFSAAVVVDGQVVGRWRRAFVSGKVAVSVMPLISLKRGEKSVIADAARAYADFLDVDLALSWT
jgi:hypothetical protein